MGDAQASTLFSAEGLVAVVTSTALEHNGATKVYIVGRRKEVLENAAKVHSLFTSKESLGAVVKTIESEVGYVNLFVNNAGICGRRHNVLPGPLPLEKDVQKFLWEDSMEEWDDTFRVNVTGAWFTSVAFLGLLDQGNKRGIVGQTSQIITVTSIANLLRNLGSCFSYNASKAAMTHGGKMLATHFQQCGIRSNMIAPGKITAGPGMMDPNNKDKLGDFPPAKVPMKRLGKDEDIAGAVWYVAGRVGAYVNGNVVIVGGGKTSIMPATY
ncbi:NAD(P)-binding protein [Choiromyces venosus 120613-1]|uniref:NAD(P)-binding protein n=1 Tax=Choiromyces venosus 120613-1 TaxID=1336337 RepID=A0A3N4JQC0_9PEZI|nr:NAD(P)-binding protein [Choiromyces venosus 120613-1]